MIFPNSTEYAKTIDTRIGDQPHWGQYVDETPYEIKQAHGYFPDSCRKSNTIGSIDVNIDKWHFLIGEPKIAIKNNTKQGYLEAEEGDGVDISARMEHHRGTVQKGLSQTLSTQGGRTKE